VKKKKPVRQARRGALALPPRLSITHSMEWHRTLTERLGTGNALLIDGSQVEEIDTAMLQLLVSAWVNSAQQGIECRWQGTSPALLKAATLIGVADALHLHGGGQTGAAHA
jgi:anti-anti-sigma regulatory factor